MSLVIFNGSPRGTGSNSKLMADSFLKGFAAESSEESKVFYLIKKKDLELHKEEFKNAEKVIFIFPLYTDIARDLTVGHDGLELMQFIFEF